MKEQMYEGRPYSVPDGTRFLARDYGNDGPVYAYALEPLKTTYGYMAAMGEPLGIEVFPILAPWEESLVDLGEQTPTDPPMIMVRGSHIGIF